MVRGMRCALVLLAFAVALLGAGQTARAADPSRVALVIGIGVYKNAPPLSNPPRDGQAIAALLRNLGFDVDEEIDIDLVAMKRALQAFGRKAAKADAAVVFYAGHGIQADHANYLIPADAVLEREHDLLYEAMPLDVLMGEAARAKKVGLIILDACRNNPFEGRMQQALLIRGITGGKGLARVDNTPPNTAVALATRSDAVAEDGTEEHSPYTAAILAHLEIPGLELGLYLPLGARCRAEGDEHAAGAVLL